MNVLTDSEAREFVASNAWASGLRLDERDNISFEDQAASSIRLNYPETPLRVTYAARLLSMLGCSGDESALEHRKPSTRNEWMEDDRENAHGLWRVASTRGCKCTLVPVR